MSRSGSAVARSGRRLPRLHAITDDGVLRGSGWADAAARVMETGGPAVAVHVRGPGSAPRTLVALADALGECAGRTGAWLFVNDRVDVALVTGAGGVHLGRGSLPVACARDVLGPGPWVGASCHDAEESAAAGADGADYVFVGSIFRTASHPGREGMGVAGLERAVRATPGVPVLGIGGIGPAETPRLVGAGAYGVAAIRGIWSADDPAAAVREYLEGLSD